MPRIWRHLAASGLLLLLSGCLEMNIHAAVHLDGSAVVEVRYSIFRGLFEGPYTAIEKNEILPLTEDEIRAVIARIPGAQLLTADISDEAPSTDALLKVGGLRRVQYRFAVKDIEDVRFNHVRFAYYPWRGARYFQFRIDKDVTPEPGTEKAVEKMGLNPIAAGLAGGRNINLKVDLPGKVLRNNAQHVEWATAEWLIPLREIVASSTPSVVSWAETAAPASEVWRGYPAQAYYLVSGQGWRDPHDLPGRAEPDLRPQDLAP